MMPTFKISSEQDGKRLDVILARLYPSYSRSYLQKWIREGRVTHEGKELIPNYRVQVGETIAMVDLESAMPDFEDVPKRRVGNDKTDVQTKRSVVGAPSPTVLFEDKSILVLNKPANLVVHPAPSHKGATLVDWLEKYLGPKVTGLFSDSSRLGVVHRLDKDTTGVLLVAKTAQAQNMIAKQFQDRKVTKNYAAFVEGIPKADKGIISAPVGRSQNVPSRMAVSSQGRPSETSFEVVESFKEVSQLNLHPKTGRTHQIRVHCAAIGHPIVGDRTYGSNIRWSDDYGINRPLLHAEQIEFQHPTTHKRVTFKAPWPKDMLKAQKLFRSGMKAVLVISFLLMGNQVVRAADSDSAPAAPAPAKHTSTASSSTSSTKAIKREMASMKEQFKSLIEEVSAVQDRVTGIQASLDELAASRRLRDLEKAISDMNGKTSGTANTTEETKSQMLDLSRKVKEQQDLIDQMRDQIDRLQHQVIQAKARTEEAPAVPAAETSK